jgi:hypothetical protein
MIFTIQHKFIKLEVLMAVTMKSIIAWDVTPCSLAEVFTDISEEHTASESKIMPSKQ